MSGDGVILIPNSLNPYPDLQGFPISSQPTFRVSAVSINENEPVTAQTTLERPATFGIALDDTKGNFNETKATLDLKRQRELERINEKEDQKTVAALAVDDIKNGQVCVMAFGIVFLILAFVAAAVAFGTPDWRIYDVNPLKADKTSPTYICDKNNPVTNTCPFFSSRRRGMFVTCYADQSLLQYFPAIIAAAPWVTGDWCVWEQKYNIQTTPLVIDDNCGQDVNFKNPQLMVAINANLMRTHWLSFALAILMMLMAIIFSIMSQFQIRVCGSLFAGIATLISTVLLIIGMSFFHGYTYMEEEVLRCPPYFGVLKNDKFKTLYQGTQAYFGFSFYLGWVSVGMGILGSSFLLVGACQRRQSQKKIEKAMDRLNQIAKEERTERKLEEIETRIKRRAIENRIKGNDRELVPRYAKASGPFGFFRNLFPNTFSKPNLRNSFGNSEIGYNLNSTKREKEMEFKKFEEREERELRRKKQELKERTEREINELRQIENNLIEAENRKINMAKPKSSRKNMKRRDDSSDSESNDSDSDNERKRKHTNHLPRYNRSLDNMDKLNPGCGKVVSPAPFMQHNSCCDPYTLHLPTGMAPAYYP